jgi:hypothetical protein
VTWFSTPFPLALMASASIVVVPAPTKVASPLFISMVATAVLLLVQENVRPLTVTGFPVVGSTGAAVNCCVSPTARLGSDGTIVRLKFGVPPPPPFPPPPHPQRQAGKRRENSSIAVAGKEQFAGSLPLDRGNQIRVIPIASSNHSEGPMILVFSLRDWDFPADSPGFASFYTISISLADQDFLRFCRRQEAGGPPRPAAPNLLQSHANSLSGKWFV